MFGNLDERDAADRLAHDVNNTAAVIGPLAELLAETNDPDLKAKCASTMLQAIDRMQAMCRATLNRSRMVREGGQYIPPSQPFDPAAVVQELAVLLEYPMRKLNLELEVQIADDFPSKLLGCPLLVSEVLFNFCTNARKYASPGSKVIIRAQSCSTGVRFSVTNSGEQIPEELRVRLFQPWVQGAAAKPGAGRGLSLCKQMVTAASGDIGLTSTGEGETTFYFTLPYRECLLPEAVAC